ncbi:DUF397 domain-containing protein [Streptomyces sp. NPDC049881]|uniref:DUF397 domain-containing protein n=1 Tax=Streptomyces sp. NPDC049881 TaxID=3155778 RepID=UPI00342DAEFF
MKSSYSGPNGDCVEARHRPHHDIDLRDSKDPNGPVVTCGITGWNAFTLALRDGTFQTR